MTSSVGTLREERPGNPSRERNIKSSSMESKSERSFWSILASRARSVLLEDDIPSPAPEKELISSDTQKQETSIKKPAQVVKLSQGIKPRGQETPVFRKGLAAIASSLSLIGDTLGSAIEEGFNLMETQASNLISADPDNSSMAKSPFLQKLENSNSYQQKQGNKKAFDKDNKKTSKPELDKGNKRAFDNKKASEPELDKDNKKASESELDTATQLKASRDVAMAMATKAKLLLRELKTVKADLTFSQDRCIQLEEENKRLRESLSKGIRPEEDDLVRLQLETLLTEKGRLAQENATYARENQFLHEVIEYHQLTTQDVTLLDESIEEVAEKVAEPLIMTSTNTVSS
ncbi:hypothetical protein O6H91_02G069100 [Diphasiastrum complanatum]|uniref:Uncharacterized protein n=1 Tax=Diphasiastrum complanatum TaxID=34168 RepID=A0ACC2EGF4_DIPCM|nr:hypothetical protein O6H91_02G069100 [Diphasiastrum complanatum]